MKKVVVFCSMLLLFASSMCLSSCSNDENLEVLKENQKEQITGLTQSSKTFKNNLIDVLGNQQTRSRIQLSSEQLESLYSTSKDVLVEFGFSTEELASYSDNHQAVILMASVIVGMYESNPTMPLSDDNDPTCWSKEKAFECFKTTLENWLVLPIIEEIFNVTNAYRCLTKKILKEALEQGAKKIPGVSIVSIIYDYSRCMGWF